MPFRADRSTSFISQDYIVAPGVQALSTAPLAAFGCRSVFVYSRPANTLPIWVGGPLLGVAGSNGIRIMPDGGISIDIDNIAKVFVVEPTNSGTQVITVFVNG